MKLAQFKASESAEQRLGVLMGEVVYDVADLARALKASGGGPPSWLLQVRATLDVISRGDSAMRDLEAILTDIRIGTALPLDSIDFLPAVYPSKIIAIGRNYVDHAIEGGAEPPKAPIILSKISSRVDYEAELAVVIGRKATRVSEASALDYVFGYTLINDVSARDLQYGDGQWTRGKGLDTFAPLGPFI